MSDSKKPKPAPATISTWLDQADAFVRREPAKVVASAFGAGFLINLLPVGAIIGALFVLARPILLCLGLLKVWEICPCKKPPNS